MISDISQEKLSLKWDDFQQNFSAVFKELRHDVDFTDVTLVCEGDVTVRAHRNILSSCSSFFKAALGRRKKTRGRKLYLRGMAVRHLEAVLDFLYLGEVVVDRGDLEEFLAVARDLGLRGLEGAAGGGAGEGGTGGGEGGEKWVSQSRESNAEGEGGDGDGAEERGEEGGGAEPREGDDGHVMVEEDNEERESLDDGNSSQDGDADRKLISVPSIFFEKQSEQLLVDEDLNHQFGVDLEEDIVGQHKEDKEEIHNKQKKSRKELKEFLVWSNPKVNKENFSVSLYKPLNTSMPVVVNMEEGSLLKDLDLQIQTMMDKIDGVSICKICGKRNRNKSHIVSHIEGVHISGLSHPCELCGKSLGSRNSLGAHVRKFHREHIQIE